MAKGKSIYEKIDEIREMYNKNTDTANGIENYNDPLDDFYPGMSEEGEDGFIENLNDLEQLAESGDIGGAKDALDNAKKLSRNLNWDAGIFNEVNKNFRRIRSNLNNYNYNNRKNKS